MTNIKIKAIDLSKDVPIIRFSTINTQTTDSVFPGKDSEPVPPAASFEDAISALHLAFSSEIPELESDDRTWSLLSVSLLWNKEGDEYGYSAKFSGFQENKPLLNVEAKETSADQIGDRVYAALQVLVSEAALYVRGVSAQLSLLAIEQEDDTEVEIEEAEDAA